MDGDEIGIYSDRLAENGVALRDHQRSGIARILSWFSPTGGHGGILADEMGLGKTCQAVAVIAILVARDAMRGESRKGGIHLVICPLSVIDHWMHELDRFGCGRLTVVKYVGDKDARRDLRREVELSPCDVLLTTYQFFINDSDALKALKWASLFLDEAHRVKSSSSLLHQLIRENNLRELYSLLTLIDARRFAMDECEQFVRRFRHLNHDETASSDLRALLDSYLLRRTKESVCMEIPRSSRVVLYHGITDMQKTLYRAILSKNYRFFEKTDIAASATNAGTSRQSLMNVLMQLRKCVVHPYLFQGQEPEPFEEGEHLVNASGKFILLDRLLKQLQRQGHRVLLFSQMTRALDVLQDYLTLRGYAYERLDGSVRAEERFAAVSQFQHRSSSTFVFLLSTRAGGVGLNLTAADTVIFLDSDFNPQNDIQAAARCHRIGQEKPVKIIRLIARHTVEEMIQFRATGKLRLTTRVIGDVDEEARDAQKLTVAEMTDLIIGGLGKLGEDVNGDEGDSRDDGAYFDAIIGRSDENGHWMVECTDEKRFQPGTAIASATSENLQHDEEEDPMPDGLYVFDGKNYKTTIEDEECDRRALEELMAETRLAGGQHDGDDQLQQRRRAPRKQRSQDADSDQRIRQVEQRSPKPQRDVQQRAEERRRKLLEKWRRAGYVSSALPDEEEPDDEMSSPEAIVPDNDDEQSSTSSYGPFFVLGDVTEPLVPVDRRQPGRQPRALILHCVDNSGTFGRGGVFTALRRKDALIADAYEKAGEMRDVKIGDAHLIADIAAGDDDGGRATKMHGTGFDSEGCCEASTSSESTASRGTPRLSCVLLVAQDRRKRDVILTDALSTCLKRVSAYARLMMSAHDEAISVHLPRIGYGMRNVQWYTVERLIRKYLTDRRIPTYIYYYDRRNREGGGNRDSGQWQQTDDGGRDGIDERVKNGDRRKRSVEIEGDGGDSDEENVCPPAKRGTRFVALFSSMVISLFGLKDDEQRERYRRVVEAFDGDTVDAEDDLWKATHAVIESGEDSLVKAEIGWSADCRARSGRGMDR